VVSLPYDRWSDRKDEQKGLERQRRDSKGRWETASQERPKVKGGMKRHEKSHEKGEKGMREEVAFFRETPLAVEGDF